MKRISLAAAAACLLSGSAYAADLAVYAPAPTWTGCYAGVHVGYSPGDRTTDAPFSDYTHNIDGPLGGIQVGCNKQVDRMVFSLLGDIAATGIDGSSDSDLGGGIIATSETQIDWLSTIRGRIGIASDNALFYITGGAAFANATINLSTNLFPEGQDQENTHFGWTVGAGLEYKISDSISVFGEYLYVDLGSEEYAYEPPLDPVNVHEVDLDLHVIKIGANYHF